MPIVKPFMASRKFTSTLGGGTGTGATFAVTATSFTDDTGAATTAITIPDGDTLDGATPITVAFVVN